MILIADENLTIENIARINEALEGVSIGDMLTVSSSKQRMLRRPDMDNNTIDANMIEYFVKCSPYASWNFITGRLYYLEQTGALSLAHTFANQSRGECIMLNYYTEICNSCWTCIIS